MLFLVGRAIGVIFKGPRIGFIVWVIKQEFIGDILILAL